MATASGDLVLSGTIDENDSNTENYTWTSSVAETWTENTESTGTLNSDVFIQTARAVTTSAWAAGTVSIARTAGDASKFGNAATVWRGSDGIGNIGNSASLTGAAPSYSFTTSTDDSALVVYAGDFQARAAAARTYTQINGVSAVEVDYFNNVANYTIYVFYFTNVGAAGAKTIQINSISSAATTIRMHAVEVKGSAVFNPDGKHTIATSMISMAR